MNIYAVYRLALLIAIRAVPIYLWSLVMGRIHGYPESL